MEFGLFREGVTVFGHCEAGPEGWASFLWRCWLGLPEEERYLRLFLSGLWLFFRAMHNWGNAPSTGSSLKMGMLSGEGQINGLLYVCLIQILLFLGSCQPVSVQASLSLLEESYSPSSIISSSIEGPLLGCHPCMCSISNQCWSPYYKKGMDVLEGVHIPFTEGPGG